MKVIQSIGPNICIRMLQDHLRQFIDGGDQVSAPSKVPRTVAGAPEPLVLPGVVRGAHQVLHQLFKIAPSVQLALLSLFFRETRTGCHDRPLPPIGTILAPTSAASGDMQ